MAGPADGGIRWLAGEPAVCEALSRAWHDPAAAGATASQLRDRPERRRLLRIRWTGGPDLFVKQFYMGGRRHRVRKRLVRLLRLEAARREWRALTRLARAGVPVPAPRALGILPCGDRILVVDFLPGRPLDAAVSEADLDRARLAGELGRLVAELHAAGIAHRDLHHGNVFLSEHGPVLLDLQLARRARTQRALRRDLGDLEASLAGALSLPQRVRLRAAALGRVRPFDDATRRALREAGAAALERARSHATSRRRRALRPGRRFARVRHAAGRGLRLRELAPEALDQALRAHEQGGGEPLRRDATVRVTAVSSGGRRLVVRESRPGGPGGCLAELLRGSAARRAWLAGFGLEALGIPAARPLALLERRRLGRPGPSLLVTEDLRPARPAPELASSGEAPVLDALTRLVGRLHALGIRHDDLSADRFWLSPGGTVPQARLAGLDRIAFRRGLSDGERLRELARLNASLPDAVDAAARLRSFARYALLQPFSGGREAARAAIATRSREAGGRWSGAGCHAAPPLRPGASPRR